MIASEKPPVDRTFALTTRGARLIGDVEFKPTIGCVRQRDRRLSDSIRERFESTQRIRLPMRPGNRS
jgi:tRNA (cytidine/uridine-2'-O-)-methyltransferase